MAANPMHLPPDVLLLDPDLQARVGIDAELVEEYTALYLGHPTFPTAGAAMDPVKVAQLKDGRMLVVDGWHRVLAARAAGCTLQACELLPCKDWDAALRLALGANARHGLRRSKADKRKAVLRALESWPEESNREIGRICQVSEGLVRKVLAELNEPGFEQNSRTETAPGEPAGVLPPAGSNPGPARSAPAQRTPPPARSITAENLMADRAKTASILRHFAKEVDSSSTTLNEAFARAIAWIDPNSREAL